MTRFYGFISLMQLAFLYLIKREKWAIRLGFFLSSEKTRVVERAAVLQRLMTEQLRPVKIGDNQDIAKSSDEGLVRVLELLKQISYREMQSNEISLASVNELLEIYREATDLNFKPFHTTINRVLTELAPDVICQQAFSQEGEDLILARLMRQDTGFFIDVGAHHPTRFSNTYKLYKRGWRGINIDPLPGSMQLFNKLRSEDVNLEMAITSENSKATVRYFMFDEPAFNSLDEKNIADAEAAGNTLTGEVEVKCASFSSILDDNVDEFSQIDLLTIDVEHHELNVLQSFPFDKFQPGIIVVEVKGLDLVNLEKNLVYNYLIGNGYFLRSYLFHSAIFLRA